MQKLFDILLAFFGLVQDLLKRRDKARADTLHDAVVADPAGVLVNKLGGKPTNASHPNSDQHSKTDSQRR